MMDMMNQFVSNAPDGTTRYGINGWFGQAAIQSTGHTVVNYENGVFTNNIDDPEIEQAELLLQEMATKNLYRADWVGYFPNDQSTLFFAMGDWALGASNAKNEDADLMIVPFPKSPNADENYLCCNYAAKMLVAKSDKGAAVATYIKCERLAATDADYQEIAKQKALVVEETASGVVKSFVTEEQYDALQSFLDTDNVTPMFDFGYGMGDRMYNSGEYTYETRGVMDNLEQALLEGNDAVDSWASLRDAWTGVIDEEISKYNN
jgi:multiple sugar transport system substrate-binding protein